MTDNEYNSINQRFDLMTTLINSQFTAVNERLDKINGKVNRHDEEVVLSKLDRQSLHEELKNVKLNHVIDCPMRPKVEELEKEKGVRLGIKHFIVGGIIFFCTLLGGIYSSIKIIESHSDKIKQQTEVQKQQTIIPTH